MGKCSSQTSNQCKTTGMRLIDLAHMLAQLCFTLTDTLQGRAYQRCRTPEAGAILFRLTRAISQRGNDDAT